MRVDLPAPLSPTSAVTLPGYTLRSTPLRTLTGPKDFFTPTSWMIGSDISLPCAVVHERGATALGRGAPLRRKLLRHSVLGALGLDIGRADVGVGGVTGGDDLLDLVGSDELRRDLDVRRAVLELGLRVDSLALEQRDGRRDGRGGLLLDRLVDRRGLQAEE